MKIPLITAIPVITGDYGVISVIKKISVINAIEADVSAKIIDYRIIDWPISPIMPIIADIADITDNPDNADNPDNGR